MPLGWCRALLPCLITAGALAGRSVGVSSAGTSCLTRRWLDSIWRKAVGGTGWLILPLCLCLPVFCSVACASVSRRPRIPFPAFTPPSLHIRLNPCPYKVHAAYFKLLTSLTSVAPWGKGIAFVDCVACMGARALCFSGWSWRTCHVIDSHPKQLWGWIEGLLGTLFQLPYCRCPSVCTRPSPGELSPEALVSCPLLPLSPVPTPQCCAGWSFAGGSQLQSLALVRNRVASLSPL